MVTRSEEAFIFLRNEINSVLDAINKQGAEAFKTGNYENAKALMAKAQEIDELKESLQKLSTGWDKLLGKTVDNTRESTESRRIKTKKLAKGLRTKEDEYRVPILTALVEMGGSSNINSVIDRVGEIMEPIFNKYDYMPLKSYPDQPRWRNATQWVRYTLVQEGYMVSDSPVGTWEITDAGRQWLAENKKLT